MYAFCFQYDPLNFLIRQSEKKLPVALIEDNFNLCVVFHKQPLFATFGVKFAPASTSFT